MYRFTPIEGNRFSPQRGRYTCYGILVWQSIDSRWVEVAIIPDISCDENYVWQLADRCTEWQMEPEWILHMVGNRYF